MRLQWAGSDWRLHVYEITRPDGQRQEKGIIRHPGSVVLVPVSGDDVLMLRQYRPALNEMILECPAGTRGWDEAWLDCAQRELREETGFGASEFIPLGAIWPAPGLSDEVMALYLATGLYQAPLSADFDEVITVEPHPLSELVAMALDGRLQDAKSALTLLRVRAWQQNQ